MQVIQIAGVDASIIMYAFGVIFGVISILYFTRDILVSLSVTVKSLVLYAVSIFMFSLSIFVSSGVISVILMIFFGSSYTFATSYVWKTYRFEKLGRFLILATSSVILLSIGRSLQTDLFTNLQGMISIVGVGLVPLIVVILVSAIDIMEEENITYKFEFKDTISDITEAQCSIGELEIENNSYFRRKFESPNIEAKLSLNDEKGLPVSYDDNFKRRDIKTLSSGETFSVKIVLFSNRTPDNTDFQIPEKCAVEIEQRDSLSFALDESEDIRLKLVKD